jgi:hypothetical protein
MSRGYRAERAESAVQVALMVAVGGVAGAAAWSHVVSLAVAHGQPGWLAWADAAVIETLAVSAGLEIRRRRRGGQPAGVVLVVLVAAVALSLAAQVAEAEPTPWGWVMAAVPAVGFLVMAKIALGRPAARTEERGARREPAGAAGVAGAGRQLGALGAEGGEGWPAQRREGAAGAGSAGGQEGPQPVAAHVAQDRTSPAQVGEVRQDRAEVEPYDDGQPLPERNGDALLAAGLAVLADLERAGVVLTRASLVSGLRARDVRISTDRATELLRQLRATPRADRRHGAWPAGRPLIDVLGGGEVTR